MALKDRRIEERRVVDDLKIEAVINKGGSAAVAEPEAEADVEKLVQIRPLQSVLDRIDSLRERKPKATRGSRHAWIMEAIYEKLQRDELEVSSKA